MQYGVQVKTKLKSFLKPYQKKLWRQKGAMFGLDARIALVILAVISIVAGIYMVQIISERRVDQLLFEQSKYASALEALQEDLETNIHSALTTSTDANAFLGFVDQSLFLAAFQNNWHGPYLREYYSTQHKDYGTMALSQHRAAINNTCSAANIRARECFYYWNVSSVPLDVITQINEQLDGSAEITPSAEGTVQWNSIASSTATLYLNIGLVAP